MADDTLPTPQETPPYEPMGLSAFGLQLVVVPDSDTRMIGIDPLHAAVDGGRILIRESEWPALRSKLKAHTRGPHA